MRIFILILLFGCYSTTLLAQKENRQIAAGNKAFTAGKYKDAAKAYSQALKINPKSSIARYNLANAQERMQENDAAAKNYQQAAASTNKQLQSNAYYNKGVSQVKNKNKDLKNAIESFKNSLRRRPEDQEARENLQKAINDLKQQNKDKNKNKKNDPKNDQNKQDKQKQNPKPESPKEKQDKQRMDQLLKQLGEQEKELQKKLQKQKNQPTKQPEKDW